MGIVTWSDHETDTVRRKYGTMPNKELAMFMGKTQNQIIGKANRMGLTTPDGRPPKRNRGKMARPEIKTAEKRTVLRYRAKKRPPAKMPESDTLKKLLVDMWNGGEKALDIARACGYSSGSEVNAIAVKMNLVDRDVNGIGNFAKRDDEPEQLGDTGANGCQWLSTIDDMKTRNFCGHDIIEGSSYCEHHHGRAYQKAARKPKNEYEPKGVDLTPNDLYA